MRYEAFRVTQPHPAFPPAFSPVACNLACRVLAAAAALKSCGDALNEMSAVVILELAAFVYALRFCGEPLGERQGHRGHKV